MSGPSNYRLCLAAIFVVSLSIGTDPVRGQEPGTACHAPDVPGQFASLAEHGDPLAAHVGVGLRDYGPDGVRPCKHYQGIARGQGDDGTPYLFLTRSRNRSNSCCEIWWQEKPGELLIVRLGSRDKDGERLRSNRLAHDRIVDDTAPPLADIGVKAIYFDGLSRDGPENGDDIWPRYWHPGGVQLLEDVLVVPMECTVGSNCLDKLDCGPNHAGVLLIDVSDPEQPDLLLHQSLNAQFPDGLGVVGVTKDPATGKYLFVFAWGDSRQLKFGWSDTNDLRTTQAITILDDVWTTPLAKDWNKWQTLNFVRDTSGELYLLGADNSSSVTTSGDDVLSLLQVDLARLKSGETQAAISWLDARQLLMAYHGRADVADLGDLDAASGFYVSPTGQLMLYAAHFKDSGADGYRIIEMGEFRNVNVSHTGTCGLQMPIDLGNPGDIEEGQQLQLEFDVHYIEPWVHMFAERSFANRSLMLDAADENADDQWGDFTKVGGDFWPSCFTGVIKSGFNDTLQSFKFCGPAGSKLQLYDDDGLKEGNSSYPTVYGTGNVISHADVRDQGLGENNFACEATSASLVWTPPAGYVIDVDWGDGAGETATRPWGNKSFVLQHLYLDDDPSGTASDTYTIELIDGEQGQSAAATKVVVKNVAPEPVIQRIREHTTGMEIGPGRPLPAALVGLPLDLDGSFTDPGTLDTHTASVDWGDGTISQLGGVTSPVSVGHAYMAPATRTIGLEVTDDDLGEGVATFEVSVVDADDALRMVAELLWPLRDERSVAAAIARLKGGAGGRAANGAIDLIQKGNRNAALGQVGKATGLLVAAEAMDPQLDIGYSKPLLALAAKSMAVEAIRDAVDAHGMGRKVAQAQQVLMRADQSLVASDYVAAVIGYQGAARAVQGLR